jgi:hypothetical protein
MLTPEDKRYIDDQIRRGLNIILAGAAGENTAHTETIESLYPGSPSITERPIMHPFGYASRAPKKIISVTARHGDHPGNRITLGHRDKNRPDDLAEGESVMYAFNGWHVYMRGGRAHLKKGSTDETLVLGEKLTSFLADLIDHIQSLLDETKKISDQTASHVHPSPGAPASNASLFTTGSAALTSLKSEITSFKESNIGSTNTIIAKDS